jgi:hypothetical protein
MSLKKLTVLGSQATETIKGITTTQVSGKQDIVVSMSNGGTQDVVKDQLTQSSNTVSVGSYSDAVLGTTTPAITWNFTAPATSGGATSVALRFGITQNGEVPASQYSIFASFWGAYPGLPKQGPVPANTIQGTVDNFAAWLQNGAAENPGVGNQLLTLQQSFSAFGISCTPVITTTSTSVTLTLQGCKSNIAASIINVGSPFMSVSGYTNGPLTDSIGYTVYSYVGTPDQITPHGWLLMDTPVFAAGLDNNTPLKLTSTGTLPAPLNANTTYYRQDFPPGTQGNLPPIGNPNRYFFLATTPNANPAQIITITSVGSGVLSVSTPVVTPALTHIELDLTALISSSDPDAHCKVSLYDKNNRKVKVLSVDLEHVTPMLQIMCDAGIDVSQDKSPKHLENKSKRTVDHQDDEDQAEDRIITFQVAPDKYSTGRVELEMSGKLTTTDVNASVSDAINGSQTVIDTSITGSGKYKLVIPFKVENI